MISPRALVVEASGVPQISGPPKESKDRNGATPNGTLATPSLAEVRAEVERARPFFQELHVPAKLQVVASAGGDGPPGSDAALSALLTAAGVKEKLAASAGPPERLGNAVDSSARMHRQFDQLVSAHAGAWSGRRRGAGSNSGLRPTRRRWRNGNPARSSTGTTSGAR